MVTTTTELIETGEKRDEKGRRISTAERRAEAVAEWRPLRSGPFLLALGVSSTFLDFETSVAAFRSGHEGPTEHVRS